MLKKGLEHDQITVNQMGNKATTTEQLANQPEVYSWADGNCINENCRISREKSIYKPTVDKRWSVQHR